MPELQATWTPEGSLFFWARDGALEQSIGTELPALQFVQATVTHRSLAQSGQRMRRRRTQGLEADLEHALPVLAALPLDQAVSDSVRCWSYAAKLGLHLAAAQRAVPSASQGEARWRALLTRSEDRESVDAIVRALPTVSRALPTRERGVVKLPTAEHAVRAFIDRTVDTVYRQGAYPGSGRGWALELAEALRGPDATFAPRDARHQAIAEQVKTWAGSADEAGLALCLELGLPTSGDASFPLVLSAGCPDGSHDRVPIHVAWAAGKHLELAGQRFSHPAHYVLRGLARAASVFPPLSRSLASGTPTDLTLSSTEAWQLLASGREALGHAGVRLIIPPEFEAAGARRIHAQIRVLPTANGRIDLSSSLTFRWEVALGDSVIDGAEFAELVARRQPIVRFRGEWVLLDPAEVERLPEGMQLEGHLPAADALRALLTGEHMGVPVIADRGLDAVLDALRQPPLIDPPDTLHGTLRPYQQRGFAWLTCLGEIGLGACLADDMGLGKTVQLIAHILHRRAHNTAPCLVVCPTSVLGNWTHELRRFGPSLKVARYHGLERDLEQAQTADVVLTTYGLLVRDADALAEVHWDVLALDEAQSIKNPASQRARAARRMTARHRVAMSGTPVENRLDDLWSLMEFLIPGLLGPRSRFRTDIAVPIERFGDDVVARRLKLGVSPFLLRRLKTDPKVITDLPEKIERKDYVTLTSEQARLYQGVVDQAMDRIQGADDFERRGHVLAMLTALKQVCNHPAQLLHEEGVPLHGRSGKLTRCEDLLDNILDLGESALLFTQYRAMGTRLQAHFSEMFEEDIPFLHGGTPATHREEMVRAFQEDADASPLLIVSLRAGGTGLNLTRATHVIHYDRWWNPAVEDQATDRAYRIGQDRNVQVHKMVTQGTLEERIDALLDEKRALADQVVGSGERWVTELDNDALRRLVALGDDAVWIDA